MTITDFLGRRSRRPLSAIAVVAVAVSACSSGETADTDVATSAPVEDVNDEPTPTDSTPPDSTAEPEIEADDDPPPPDSTAAEDPPGTEIEADELPDLPDLATVERGAALLDVTSEYNDEWSAINLLDGRPDIGWSGLGAGGSFTIGIAHPQIEAVGIDTREAQEATYPGISGRRVLVEKPVDPALFPNVSWEPVGTLDIGPSSLGLIETPGLIAPYLRFTVEDGGTEAYTEIMEIMVYGPISERQISFEVMGLVDSIAPEPLAVDLLGESWNFVVAAEEVVGCSDAGSTARFQPSEGGLVGTLVDAEGGAVDAVASMAVTTFSVITDPAGSAQRGRGEVDPVGSSACTIDADGASPADVDDDVIEALPTPESQRSADPLLVVAAARGDLDEVNAQLASGGDPNIARSNDGWTPLLFAAQDGYIDVVQALLDAGADPDRGTDDNWTALMIASQNGHDDTVAALIAGGADARVGRSSNWTALHSATLRNHPGAAAQLIAASAPIEAAEDGFTPLTIAAQEGNDAIVTLLLDAGSRADGSPAAGPTPIYMATQNDHPGAVSLLLDGGANPSLGGTNDPPIVVAGARSRGEIARLLVDGGADIDQQRADGLTALHWAAYNDDADVATILLELGASTTIFDDDGNTPLDLAILRDSDAAAEVLRNA